MANLHACLWLLVAAALGCARTGGRSWVPGPSVAAEPPVASRLTAGPAAAETVRTRLRAVLNLPAYRLDLFDGPRLVARYPVAVGDSRFPTPVGSFRITRVEWNPWWFPPASGWARSDTVTPPGSANPMGRVKMRFHGDYFLHGTPMPETVGQAASHGCVRLSNHDAVTLAGLIHRYASPELSAGDIGRLADRAPGDGTVRVTLRHPVELEIRYDIVEVLGDQLVVHRDVYGRQPGEMSARLLGALVRVGLDPRVVDPGRLRAVARESAAGPYAIAIVALLAPHLWAFAWAHARFTNFSQRRRHLGACVNGPLHRRQTMKLHLPERRRGGFSLDDAARMRRILIQAVARVECPRCGVPTEHTRGRDAGGVVWLLHCGGCGRSLIIHVPDARVTAPSVETRIVIK